MVNCFFMIGVYYLFGGFLVNYFFMIGIYYLFGGF